jgi:hypothetical protein
VLVSVVAALRASLTSLSFTGALLPDVLATFDLSEANLCAGCLVALGLKAFWPSVDPLDCLTAFCMLECFSALAISKW